MHSCLLLFYDSMADFEKAKALLQRKQGSTSVYDHLSEVLLKLITEDPADSVALFEHISGLVKKASYPGETTGSRAGGQADEGQSKAAALAWAGKASRLFAAPEAADGVSPGKLITMILLFWFCFCHFSWICLCGLLLCISCAARCFRTFGFICACQTVYLPLCADFSLV